MAKLSKPECIKLIVAELEKGTPSGKIFGQIRKKSDIVRSTYQLYLKTAIVHHTESQEAIKKAKALVDIQNGINERKNQIADANERKEILTKIARGELKIKRWVPDYTDRRNAIAELNKMEGDYAATKTELTGKGGKAIEIKNPSQIDYSKLSSEVLDAIINASTTKEIGE